MSSLFPSSSYTISETREFIDELFTVSFRPMLPLYVLLFEPFLLIEFFPYLPSRL